MAELVNVTFLDTGETLLIPYKNNKDFEVTCNGQEAVMELDRAQACMDAGALVRPPDDTDDEVLTITNVWGVDKTTYDY